MTDSDLKTCAASNLSTSELAKANPRRGSVTARLSNGGMEKGIRLWRALVHLGMQLCIRVCNSAFGDCNYASGCETLHSAEMQLPFLSCRAALFIDKSTKCYHYIVHNWYRLQ